MAFSLIKIWFIDNSIVLFYAIIVILLALSMGYTLFSKNSELMGFKAREIKLWNLNFIINVFIIILIGVSYLLRNFDGQFYLKSFFSLLITSFCSGYLILEWTFLERKLSFLEKILLSFILSMLFSAIFFFVIKFIINTPHLFSLFYLVLLIGASSKILLDILLKLYTSHKKNTKSQYKIRIELSRQKIVTYLCVYGYFLITYAFLYPDFLLLIKTDIARHYSNVLILLQQPEKLHEFFYFNFYFHQSMFVSLAGADYFSNLIALLFLTLALPTAVLQFTKNFFNDEKNPGKTEKKQFFATTTFLILFPSFGSLSWVLTLIEKFRYSFLDTFHIYTKVAKFSSNSIFYSLQGLWFIPLFASFSGFLLILAWLRKEQINQYLLIVLETIIIFFMYTVHVAEGTIICTFISLIYVLKDYFLKYRIKEACIAGILGTSLSLFYFMLIEKIQVFPHFSMSLVMYLAFILPLALLCISFLFTSLFKGIKLLIFKIKITNQKNKKDKKIQNSNQILDNDHPKRKHTISSLIENYKQFIQQYTEAKIISRKMKKKFIILEKILLILLILIVSGFFGFAAYTKYHDYSNYITILVFFSIIPWMDYSLFGANFFLFIGALVYIAIRKSISKNQEFSILFVLFTFTFGKIITFININLNLFTYYYEKRIVVFTVLAMSLVITNIYSAIPKFVKFLKSQFIKKFPANRSKLIKYFDKISIASIFLMILIANTIILPINMSYWKMYSHNYEVAATRGETELVRNMKEILDDDPLAWVIFLSQRSYDFFSIEGPMSRKFLNTDLNPSYRKVIRSITRDGTIKHPYVYVAERDMENLENNPNLKSILQISPIALQSDKVFLFNLSSGIKYPQSNQNLAISFLKTPIYNDISFGVPFIAYSGNKFSYNQYQSDQFTVPNLILNEDMYPTDPSLQNLNKFEWKKYSGHWNLSEDNPIYFGNSNVLEDGIIYSSHAYSNLNLTMNLAFDEIDTTVSNYFKIFYDISDSKIENDLKYQNFDKIILHFNKENNIYLQNDENWPGMDLGMDWKGILNKKYEMNFDFNGSRIIYRLNDQILFETPANSIDHFALSYNRILKGNVEITQFNGTCISHQLNIDQYYNYVSNGGNLLILNSNGNSIFSDRYLETTNSFLKINQVSINAINFEVEDLKFNLNTLKFDIEANENISRILDYDILNGNSEIQIPFLISENYGNGKIYFMNVYPIVNYLYDSFNNFPISQLAKGIFENYIELSL